MIQRFRVPLGFAIAAAVLYLAQPNPRSIAFGLPVALIGAAFRFLAAGVIRKDSSLATTGVYGWTRNPLYFGSFMLAAGFAVMSANWISAVLLVIPSAVIYPVVIRREEAHLEKLFPEEFGDYCARVPGFFPRPRSSKMSFSLNQYIANREYNTLLGFVAVLGIFIIKTRMIPLLS
jgi:protein-S-isoprenylcysteine O-methyltransferase Ste14